MSTLLIGGSTATSDQLTALRGLNALDTTIAQNITASSQVDNLRNGWRMHALASTTLDGVNRFEKVAPPRVDRILFRGGDVIINPGTDTGTQTASNCTITTGNTNCFARTISTMKLAATASGTSVGVNFSGRTLNLSAYRTMTVAIYLPRQINQVTIQLDATGGHFWSANYSFNCCKAGWNYYTFAVAASSTAAASAALGLTQTNTTTFGGNFVQSDLAVVSGMRVTLGSNTTFPITAGDEFYIDVFESAMRVKPFAMIRFDMDTTNFQTDVINRMITAGLVGSVRWHHLINPVPVYLAFTQAAVAAGWDVYNGQYLRTNFGQTPAAVPLDAIVEEFGLNSGEAQSYGFIKGMRFAGAPGHTYYGDGYRKAMKSIGIDYYGNDNQAAIYQGHAGISSPYNLGVIDYFGRSDTDAYMQGIVDAGVNVNLFSHGDTGSIAYIDAAIAALSTRKNAGTIDVGNATQFMAAMDGF